MRERESGGVDLEGRVGGDRSERTLGQISLPPTAGGPPLGLSSRDRAPSSSRGMRSDALGGVAAGTRAAGSGVVRWLIRYSEEPRGSLHAVAGHEKTVSSRNVREGSTSWRKQRLAAQPHHEEPDREGRSGPNLARRGPKRWVTPRRGRRRARGSIKVFSRGARPARPWIEGAGGGPLRRAPYVASPAQKSGKQARSRGPRDGRRMMNGEYGARSTWRCFARRPWMGRGPRGVENDRRAV